MRPLRLINAVAPIRVCDTGGWTDTWFAGRGSIFNIGVYPYIEVQVEVFPRDAQPERITVFAENYGERFTATPGQGWNHHPLIEAAIERMAVPDDLALRITLFSEVPGGASTGTSASVAVALIGALDLLTPGRMTPHEAAYAAHAVETEMLKRQSGIQDQLCAAYGGINFIDMHAYPRASVSQLHVPNTTWWELERRLALIFLGRTHDSSQVHEKVIRELEDAGPDNPKIAALRRCAERSRDAAYAGDLQAFGQAMIANTEAQAELNPALVSADARRVIEIARAHSAIGWKVNGAGGDGGSLTLLCGDLSHGKREMLRAIEAEVPPCRAIPIYLSRFGLRVWEG
jgi:D-glycero-alpha-D-manno-heptose-7-phosphate kinase